jgi:hypothetical protein
MLSAYVKSGRQVMLVVVLRIVMSEWAAQRLPAQPASLYPQR